jgi:hypothetical protein
MASGALLTLLLALVASWSKGIAAVVDFVRDIVIDRDACFVRNEESRRRLLEPPGWSD